MNTVICDFQMNFPMLKFFIIFRLSHNMNQRVMLCCLVALCFKWLILDLYHRFFVQFHLSFSNFKMDLIINLPQFTHIIHGGVKLFKPMNQAMKGYFFSKKSDVWKSLRLPMLWNIYLILQTNIAWLITTSSPLKEQEIIFA